jgi:hypothetical protein
MVGQFNSITVHSTRVPVTLAQTSTCKGWSGRHDLLLLPLVLHIPSQSHSKPLWKFQTQPADTSKTPSSMKQKEIRQKYSWCIVTTVGTWWACAERWSSRLQAPGLWKWHPPSSRVWEAVENLRYISGGRPIRMRVVVTWGQKVYQWSRKCQEERLRVKTSSFTTIAAMATLSHS